MEKINISDKSIKFLKLRCLSDLAYGQNHPASKAIRCGTLERKTRFLKFYNSGFYVLTSSGFLHQFKSEKHDCDQIPIMSLFLRECEICECSSADSQIYKFSLKEKKHNNDHKVYTWIFRTKTYQELLDWYNDIKKFTGISHMAGKELRDYILALQTKNTVDDRAENDRNGISDEKKRHSLLSNHDFKNDVDIMTSISSALYETEKLQTSNVEHDEHIVSEKEVVNLDGLINENIIIEKDLRNETDLINKKDTCSDEKNALSSSLDNNVSIIKEESSGKNVLFDAPILLDTSSACLNDSVSLKEMTILKSSLSDSSSTNNCNRNCNRSGSLHVVSESQTNNQKLHVVSKPLTDNSELVIELDSELSHPELLMESESQLNHSELVTKLDSQSTHSKLVMQSNSHLDQELSMSASSELCQLPSMCLSVQSKFKENLDQSSSNTDTVNISKDKLDFEDISSVYIKSLNSSMNEKCDISNMPITEVLDSAESLCPQDSLTKLDCQSLSAISSSVILEKSNSKENLQECIQE